MSCMKAFAQQIKESGIDYRVVDFEDVEAFVTAYQEKTGRTLTMIQAAQELYGSPIKVIYPKEGDV